MKSPQAQIFHFSALSNSFLAFYLSQIALYLALLATQSDTKGSQPLNKLQKQEDLLALYMLTDVRIYKVKKYDMKHVTFKQKSKITIVVAKITT